jgi:4'-phosphopantetheinyl transferase
MTVGTLQVWTMRTEGLADPDVAPWLNLLNAQERARAGRYVFGQHRNTYIAAHALTRVVLSRLDPATPAAAWRFEAGPHGKPRAWVDGRPGALTFNLSHTDGLVGLATLRSPGCELGFDVERIDRKVTLAVADRFFRPEETAWLQSLPEPGRPEGFLRLWTLKEAFIKATGEGLARDLASFWFTLPPPRIRFEPPGGDDPADWHFEQRVVAGSHLAAVGLRRPPDHVIAAGWLEVDPAEIR